MRRSVRLLYCLLLAATIPGYAQVFTYQKNNLKFEVEVIHPCNAASSNGSITFRMLSSGSGQVEIVLIAGPINSIFPKPIFNTTNSNTFAYSPPAPQTGVYDFILRDPLNDADVVNTYTSAYDGITVAALTPPKFTVSTLINNTDCDNPNGQLVVDVTGGSRSPALSVPGSFNFIWNSNRPLPGLVLQNDFDGSTPLNLSSQLGLAGLPGGDYLLKVSDYYSSCFTDSTFTLTDDSPLKYTVLSPTAPACANTPVSITLSNSEGSQVFYEVMQGTTPLASVPAVFGTNAPLTFTIPGATFTTEGTYTFNIRATNGSCLPILMDGSAIVNVPSVVKVTAATTSPTCGVSTTGGITLNASGGAGNFQYSIDNGATFVSSAVFSTLQPGSYQTLAKDGNGCVSIPVTATINPLPTITVAATPNPPACAGNSNGSISIVASGGTASYTYSINNGNTFVTGAVFNNLVAGTYPVLVKDAQGCLSSPSNVTLTDPQPIVLTLSRTDLTNCQPGNDGSITASASGGTAAYTFSINNGAFQSSGNFTTLKAGSYTITVKDVKGCVATSSENITAPSPTLNYVTQDPTCFGSQTGGLVINTVGGAPPFAYSIDNGVTTQTGNSFTLLKAGTYNLYVIDSKFCTAVANATLQQPAKITAASITPTKPTCTGLSNGSLTFTGAGGNGTFEFSLNNGVNYQSSGTFSGLAAGNFQVLIRDGQGCVSDAIPAQLTEPAILTVTTVPTAAGCTNDNGSVFVSNVAGGTSPYTFTFNGTSYPSLPTNKTFSGLAAGNYELIVIDANNCTTSNTTTVTFPGFITASNLAVAPDCLGDGTNGRIDLTISTIGTFKAGISTSATSTPTSFQDITSAGAGSATFNNLKNGTYFVTITHSTLCTFKETVLISGGPDALGFNLVVKNPACFEDIGSISATAITGSPAIPYTLEILNGGTVIQTKTITATEALSAVTLPITSSGSYQTRLIQDQSTVANCTNPITTQLIDFIIKDGPPVSLDTVFTERTISYLEQGSGSIRAVISETGLEPYQSRLELTTPIQDGQTFFSDYFSLERNEENKPELFYDKLFAGTYTLMIKDGYGCVREYLLEIDADREIFIPNIFTPNDDGVNDSFYVRNLAFGSTIVISNRWGKEIFSSTNYDNSWTGKNQPDGIYFYRLVTAGQVFTGWLELLRGK